MNFITIEYFSNSDKGISAEDFKNQGRQVKINLEFILSLSELRRFTLPFSGQYVDSYALLTMSNNDRYYIKAPSYTDLEIAIDHIKLKE
jgi:hypothetical protein